MDKEDDAKAELKKNRHAYYLERKDVLNERARQRYKEKRVDPEFYKSMLQSNNDHYHKRLDKQTVPLTEEEEEAYFLRVVRNIKAVHELDINKPPAKALKFNVLMGMFKD